MRKTIIILTLLVLLTRVPFHAALAIEAEKLVILNTVPAAGEDALDLRVYVTVKDTAGSIVPRNDIDLEPIATIQLLGQRTDTVEATVEEPDSPIRIVMLIDNSGSIGTELLVKIKEAASEAIKNAPENAEIAVFRFSDVVEDQPFLPIEDFTKNRELAIEAIKAIPNPAKLAPTCLYNATLRAIDHVAKSSSNLEDRRAVIVFTDGIDERITSNGTREACSQNRSAEDVITKGQAEQTPVYTIGLCAATGDKGCANIEEFILQKIGRETNGSYVTGTEDKLSERFREIMEALKSQWLVRATLRTPLGPNQAVVTVTTRKGVVLTEQIAFDSAREYLPAASAAMAVSQDSENGRFLVLLTISNPESLTERLFIEITSNKTKLPIGEPIPLNIETLERKVNGQYILPVPFERFNEQSDTYCFALRQGVAAQPVVPPACIEYVVSLGFEILSVTPDYTKEQLHLKLKLDLQGGVPQERQLAWTITEKSGSAVYDSTTDNESAKTAQINGDVVTLPLPRALKEARQETPYTITLTVLAGNLQSTAAKEFTPPLLPQPSIILPVVLGIAFLGALGLAGYFGVRATRNRPKPIAPPPIVPPGPYTPPTSYLVNTAAPAIKRGGAIRIQVVKTSAPSQMKLRREFSEFPVVVGRSGDGFVIAGDDGLSRSHMEIDLRDGALVVIPRPSANGTFINEQLIPPGTLHPLTTPLQIRLGPNTVVEVSQI